MKLGWLNIFSGNLLLLQEMINNFEEQIPKLGLEEDQEAYLLSTLDSTIVATNSIVENGDNTSNAFRPHSTVELTSGALSKLQVLLYV